MKVFKLTEQWRSMEGRSRFLAVFLGVLFAGVVLFAVQSLIQYGQNLNNAAAIEGELQYPAGESLLHGLAFFFYDNELFFQDRNDLFMDFFSINNMVASNSPYIIGDSSYPPFILMVAKLFAAFTDYEKGAALARYSVGGMLSVAVFYAVCLVPTLALLIAAFRRGGYPWWTAVLVFVALFFSTPLLFILDRGNYSLLAVPFLGFFFLYYRSSKAWLRELSYLALAVAAAIKIYPAAFALILLTEHRFAGFVRTAAYSVLLLILPFFAFDGGLDNVSAFLYWLLDFSGSEEGSAVSTTIYGISYSYALYNLVSVFAVILGLDIEAVAVPAEGLAKFFVVLSVLLVFFVGLLTKRRWKTAMASALATLFVPNISFVYSAVMVFLPLVMFLLDRNKDRWDIAYCALFLLLFLPVNLGYVFGYNVNAFRYGCTVANLVQLLSLVAMLLTLTADTAICLIRRLKKRKEELTIPADSSIIET